MRVFLTGATGYIGAAVLDRLLAEGHQVTALVRDPLKAETVRARGADPALGDVSDAATVHRLADAADGVIHLAAPGDDSSARVDDAAATHLLAALKGSDRPYIHTTGIWVHGSGSAITESTPMSPPRLTAWRVPIAERVLSTPGVRVAVVAPAIVYGHGGGLLNVVASGPRTEGNAPALTMIGHGDQHWSTVHVDDLADLYVRALESAPAGSYFIGASGVSPTVREITQAVSRTIGLSGRVAPEPVAQTLERLGLLGEALLLDQQAGGDAARRILGWTPQQPTILDDIAANPLAAAS